MLLGPFTLSPTADAHAACGSRRPPNLDATPISSKGHGINMRSGSSTACAITGEIFGTHQVDYYCWTTGSPSGYTWTYAGNVTASYAGWMRDDLLNDGGSKVWCGF
ncbi:SH3 domain-containing protein [Streptomyces sp. NPDC091292]|uniref:SH3 domain-containing protein n=1 Tax=Streptomyces sp. NPDC091292 TaxID=3365991 RepID=UPI00382AD569